MLIEFTVGNYRSFKDPMTLSTLATRLSSKDPQLDIDNVIKTETSPDLLRTMAIYGANSSGKSNLIKAMLFMKEFVLNSSRAGQVSDEIKVEPFRLSTETVDKPSFFEIVFVHEKKQYRYGFEATKTEVTAEWLYHVPSKREAELFSRVGQDISISGVFKEGNGLTDKTRNNALFLSVVAQFNGAMSNGILSWFKDLKFAIDEVPSHVSGMREFTAGLFQKPALKKALLAMLVDFDTGISDITIESFKQTRASLPSDMPDQMKDFLLEFGEKESFKVRTHHPVVDSKGKKAETIEFSLESHESGGTQKLFDLLGPVLITLVSGGVLIIDEVDSRLHTLLSMGLIDLFQNEELKISSTAQLIFSTHDIGLLSNDRFRRDQIWFTNKDRYQASHLYSLAEYKIRKNTPFTKGYLRGHFGGVPFLNQTLIDFLNDDSAENTEVAT